MVFGVFREFHIMPNFTIFQLVIKLWTFEATRHMAFKTTKYETCTSCNCYRVHEDYLPPAKKKSATLFFDIEEWLLVFC